MMSVDETLMCSFQVWLLAMYTNGGNWPQWTDCITGKISENFEIVQSKIHIVYNFSLADIKAIGEKSEIPIWWSEFRPPCHTSKRRSCTAKQKGKEIDGAASRPLLSICVRYKNVYSSVDVKKTNDIKCNL
jgi:hypothetical protein